jgi:hypothetical protein
MWPYQLSLTNSFRILPIESNNPVHVPNMSQRTAVAPSCAEKRHNDRAKCGIDLLLTPKVYN